MRTALAIRHLIFEDLGILGPLLQSNGFEIIYWDAGVDKLQILEDATPDLLVILGGPIGATDFDDYPFLRHEYRELERMLASGVPVLGICLGAQIIAHLYGARIFPAPIKEIGWDRLQLTQAGTASPLRHIGDSGVPVLHWHGDTFDLPARAQLLASTANVENQAYSLPRILGLQFHLEANPKRLEQWLIGHTGEISETPHVSANIIRHQTELHGPALLPVASQVFTDWLRELTLIHA